MKKALLLLIVLPTMFSARATDTLTIRQVYNFNVGDVFDYRVIMKGYYYGSASGLIPWNICYERFVVDSKTLSPNNDTVYYSYTQTNIGPGNCPIITPLQSLYTNLDSNIISCDVHPQGDSAYGFFADSINGYRANTFHSVQIPNSSAYYSAKTRIYIENHGYFYASDTSQFADPDIPNEPFYDDHTIDLIYFSNGVETFGTPYDIAASNSELTSAPPIHLYPTPTSDILHLSYSDANQHDTHLIITDLLGREVYTTTISQSETTHDISLFSSGIYSWRLVADGIVLRTGKVVKQ